MKITNEEGHGTGRAALISAALLLMLAGPASWAVAQGTPTAAKPAQATAAPAKPAPQPQAVTPAKPTLQPQTAAPAKPAPQPQAAVPVKSAPQAPQTTAPAKPTPQPQAVTPAKPAPQPQAAVPVKPGPQAPPATAQAKPAPQAPPTAAPAKPAPPTAQAKAPVQPEPYRYTSEGRIDPFKPLPELDATARKKMEQAAVLPKNPLQRMAVEQFRLVGIIESSHGRRAMVQDPTGKFYSLVPGSYIGLNSGRVTAILKDSVIVNERVTTDEGKTETRRQVMKLRQDEVRP